MSDERAARHERRDVTPAASKRPAALDLAARAIELLLPADSTDEDTPHAPDAPDAGAEDFERYGTGVEPPLPEWVEVSNTLERYFAFVDICGFTAFTDRHGALASTEVLTRFRSAVRDVTGRRGVRVLKWLGDGAMLVGVEPGPLVAAAVEIELRFEGDAFEVHAGLAGGPVLIFEGDDYIGRPINLAARLCEAAGPGEILAHGLRESLPRWVVETGRVTVRAAGIGDVRDVSRITAKRSARALAAGDEDELRATMAP